MGGPKKEAPQRDVIAEQIAKVIADNKGTSGITGRIAKTAQALNQGQVKAALMMTDREKLDREHQIVVDVAKKCVADKDNCLPICKEGAQQLLKRVTTEFDATDLEGIEELLKPREGKPVEEVIVAHVDLPAEATKTDEELYRECQECHIADAVVKFVNISEQDCNGKTGTALKPLLDDPLTPPEKWIKTMREVASQDGCGQPVYKEVLGELEGYLKERGSPLLEKASEEVPHA